MGGGDLNLKKSWHPSTLRNIERVWKAEQKHDAEQRKIEQLQKELHDERAKEEMRQYAEDQGVVKKKNERLDWMYQGPAALIDREQYLVGRSVDRTFEVLDQLENNKLPEDDSNQPGAIFGQSSVNMTIDLANKIREDPLFSIKKKETEEKKNLLNNPVRMKQLRELLEMEVASKSKKKHKKSKKHKMSKESGKSMKLHRDAPGPERMHFHKQSSREEIRNKWKHPEHVEKRQKKRFSSESESDSSSDNTSDDVSTRNTKRMKNDRHTQYTNEEYGNRKQAMQGNDYRSKPYGLILNKNAHHFEKHSRSKPYQQSRSRSPTAKAKKVVRVPSPPRRKLTEEEMEEKRRLMMDNAKWRDEQRERNIKKYKKEEEKHEEHKGKPADFIRPMLSAATEIGSVESRIRQKMFSVQRSSSAMNENFARK